MNDIIITPLLLGLSTGVYCFTYCIPFLASYLVAEKHRSGLGVTLEFILGRFLGYLLFGAVFGFLGARISNSTANLVVVAAMVPLAVLMILYGAGALRHRNQICVKSFAKVKVPLLMGFLTGVNICPPFLMSLGYVFTLHAALRGVVFFILFFVGTSVYFIPVSLLGILGRSGAFRFAGRLASVLVGASFLIYSLFYILRGTYVLHQF